MTSFSSPRVAKVVLRPGLVLASALVFAAAAGASGVKVATGADGLKVIFSESSAQHARRTSTVLLATPDLDLDMVIERHSNTARLDPKLVRAVIQVESGYNPRALSNKGAMGLMQLMPATAKDLAVTDPYDISQNVAGGTLYLRQMLNLFQGSTELAVAAYNAGPGAVQRHGGIPPYAETDAYVRRVLGLYRGETVTLVGGRVRIGKPVFLVRDGQNRIVLTTAALGSR